MSNKVTMKVPEWQRDVINKIQEQGYPNCDQSETLGKILTTYGAFLVVQRTEGFITYPERSEVEIELLDDNRDLKRYWASVGADNSKEALMKEIELMDKECGDDEE